MNDNKGTRAIVYTFSATLQSVQMTVCFRGETPLKTPEYITLIFKNYIYSICMLIKDLNCITLKHLKHILIINKFNVYIY